MTFTSFLGYNRIHNWRCGDDNYSSTNLQLQENTVKSPGVTSSCKRPQKASVDDLCGIILVTTGFDLSHLPRFTSVIIIS